MEVKKKTEKDQTQNKATDKVKKRFQKRYYETQPDTEKSQKTETYHYDGGNVSSWRVKKWKKRRLQKAEDSADKGPSNSKSKKAKTSRETKLDDLEEAGYLEYDSGEEVDNRLSQTAIAEAVDVSNAQKYFELNLTDFGPYGISYSRNGRHLLLGGHAGHLASFDWQSKKLLCEINVDPVSCVKWLHQETMFAAAHPAGVCVYDNQGIEVHDLTNLDVVLRMEFLPHHMLLATSNAKGFLAYTDVSIGSRAAGICTGQGRLDVMTQNPANAVIHLGHSSGTVTLWAPSVKGPLVKMLAHKAPVRALAIDSTGNYMATSGIDKRVKVFDLRTHKLLNKTHIPVGASSLAFSQQGLLAAALGNTVQIYKDCRKEGVVTPYLSHVLNGSVQQVEFCPFEDVLGVGHQRGFSSLLVPGSGEANFDAFSVNPMSSKKQRQHSEVRLLLDKLQPEMIGLTNWVTEIGKNLQEPRKLPASVKKLGKKQREEQQREMTRDSVIKQKKSAKRSETKPGKDPLSRFKKQST